MLAIAPGRGRAAPVQQRQQPHARWPYQPRARWASNRISSSSPRSPAQPAGLSRPQGAAEALQVLGGQVYPAVPKILLNVTQDVRQLQRDPQRVGQRLGGGRVPAAEHAERKPPDRPGHTPAVVLELVECGVAGALDVGLAAVDQLAEGAAAGSRTCAPRRPARPEPGRRRAARRAAARSRRRGPPPAPRSCPGRASSRRRCHRPGGRTRRPRTARAACPRAAAGCRRRSSSPASWSPARSADTPRGPRRLRWRGWSSRHRPLA